jgi:hypothetical protein
MNQRIQNKIERYKKMASATNAHAVPVHTAVRHDSLAQVIRSKKDADEFMAELENAVKRVK